jgi:hypothetical protein
MLICNADITRCPEITDAPKGWHEQQLIGTGGTHTRCERSFDHTPSPRHVSLQHPRQQAFNPVSVASFR